MARVYTNIQIVGYPSTYELQEKIGEFINKAQDAGHYAEIQYSINNSSATALMMEYWEK